MRLRHHRGCAAEVFALLSLMGALSGCREPDYPLTVVQNKLVFETRDRTGAQVMFMIDTGSPTSFLSREWVERAGGHVEAGPPSQWAGLNIGAQGKERARDLPTLAGVPPVLNGLPVFEGSPTSPLAGPLPVVGLLGTDLFWDCSLDFRGSRPLLVHRSLPEARTPSRVRYDLYLEQGHYAVPISLWAGDGSGRELPSPRAVVDTGSPLPLLVLLPTTPDWLGVEENPLGSLRTNGFGDRFFPSSGFLLGAYKLAPFVALAVEAPSYPTLTIVGLPVLTRYRAVVDLKAWSLTVDLLPRPEPYSSVSTESWGWRASLVPGKGVRVEAVVPGSSWDLWGYRTGDWITRVGAEPVDKPRSVLEWRRTWFTLATQPPQFPQPYRASGAVRSR